jgi:hypothetical protein
MQGNFFVASEDDTSGWQEEGRHCDTRQGQGFRSAARNNEAGQGQDSSIMMYLYGTNLFMM